MGKLRDLVSRGISLIVTDVEEPAPKPAPPPEREIPGDVFDEPVPEAVTHSEVPADVTSFDAVYTEAGIEIPLHGYGVDKVAEMLSSKHLGALTREVRSTAVMAALEAAGAPIRDVIQDAVRRDRALDAFEAAKEKQLVEARTAAEAKVKELLAEIEAFVKAKNAEIEGLKKNVAAAEDAFSQLQSRKRREEERLHDVVAHFVQGAEIPITRSGPGLSPPPPPPHEPGKA